jgi:hypothetical protein
MLEDYKLTKRNKEKESNTTSNLEMNNFRSAPSPIEESLLVCKRKSESRFIEMPSPTNLRNDDECQDPDFKMNGEIQNDVIVFY